MVIVLGLHLFHIVIFCFVTSEQVISDLVHKYRNETSR